MENEKSNKTQKLLLFLGFILLLLILLIIYIYSIASSKRDNSFLTAIKYEMSIRGDIYSAENYKIASSKKIYKVTIDTRFLDLNKIELFIKLFSIYSGIPYEKVEKKINESLKDPSSIVLSYNIDSKTASYLKELSFKLKRLEVFQYKTINNQRRLVGLDISESGEKRSYSYDDSLTPAIGYIRKRESKDGITRVEGIKGIEKYFNKSLNNYKDGIISGSRDVLSYINLNTKKFQLIQREDGNDVKLTIPLKLQKNIELEIDRYKKILNASEVIVSIMESKTGNILTLASSNRFNPENILQEQISYLNVKAIEFPFEPGSIIKPISIALAMDKNKIKNNEIFFAYNKGDANSKGEFPKGSYKLDKFNIHDDHRFKKHYLTLEDIVIHSSNIGTLFIAQRLKGYELLNGMKEFGFLNKTGIELPYERVGRFPTLKQLSAFENTGKDNIYKATVSYGQGMTATFMQLLKAYSVFNNNGFITTPKLTLQNEEIPKRVISQRTSNEMKNLLIKTVNDGTGQSTYIKGLEIGGKTGTAQVARKGEYQKEYISSFFGFANDEKNSYTIGVTVFNPNSKGEKYYQYYASQSAAPIFKEVVKILVKQNYLKKSNL